MKDIRPLKQTLAEHLPWHKARVKFVAAFVLGIVSVNRQRGRVDVRLRGPRAAGLAAELEVRQSRTSSWSWASSIKGWLVRWF